jgi:hypothetical protein
MRDLTTLYTEWRAANGFYAHNEYSMTDRLMLKCFKGGLVTGINGTLLEIKDRHDMETRRPGETVVTGMAPLLVHGRN